MVSGVGFLFLILIIIIINNAVIKCAFVYNPMRITQPPTKVIY